MKTAIALLLAIIAVGLIASAAYFALRSLAHTVSDVRRRPIQLDTLALALSTAFALLMVSRAIAS